MSDMNSMSRENRKRQLRRRVISSDTAYNTASVWENEEDSEDVVRRAKKKVRRKHLVVLAAVVVIGLAAFAGVRYYRMNYSYTSFETSWEIPMNEGSLVGYELFGSNILKYTKDGASYMDNRGRNVWTESYEMKSPIISVNGSFVAIADQQGNSIYICNEDGKQGEATTVLPISKVAVSGTGIVAAVLEDSTSSYITFFKKDGTSLDITVKTKMAGDGYPLDISLSQDGTQLMCSYVYLQGGELKNRVVFYDFSEIGKNVPNRLVGGFDDPFNGTMVPRVTYLNEPYSCAFTGNGPVFFSSKNLASPEMISQAAMEEDNIRSVFFSDNYVGVIVRNSGGEEQERMEIYKADGSHVLSKEFTYEYTDAEIIGDLIILHDDHSCRIYNMAGVEKLYAEFDFTISKISKGRFPNTLLVTGPQLMREIRMK
jgi:hypothetical protein